MMRTRLRAALATAVLAVALTACSAELPEQTAGSASDAAAATAKLDKADTIQIKKDAMSIGDHWSIKVNGEEVAKIDGLDLKAFGDTYSITSPAGGYMGGEDEDIVSVSRTAHFYDKDQQPTSTLKKELLSFQAKYHLTAGGTELASLDQKFSWGFKGVIKDGDGREAWAISRKVVSISSDITLTRKTSDTKLSAVEAILMTVVASEVYDAENDN